MTLYNHGAGRTLPADVDTDGGKVLVTDPSTSTGLAWVEAGETPYTPTTSGDWPGTDPTTVQEALDQLAERLTALE